MVQNEVQHPDVAQLTAFGLGKLDPQRAAEIEDHVARCDPCCKTLSSLEDDTFAGLVRSSDKTERSPASLPADAQPTAAEPPTGLPVSATTQKFENIHDLPADLAEHSRYEVSELLGTGGMGTVYRAKHRLMQRTVALKVINSRLTFNEAAVERFQREVRAAAKLSHPNIVAGYDAEQAGRLHLLVMEFVDGTDLGAVMRERGPLPVRDACNYVSQAARGLEHAFEFGMVHRDIKPQNLMLTPDGQVKILDFGIAQLAGEASGDGLTAEGSMMGTPDYMAPEQARDARSADIRADVYSLGCTLYALLTGQPPFPEGSDISKVMAHTEQEPKPVSEFRDDVPDELIAVLNTMTAKNPEDRYQTPADVADALAGFVDRYRSDRDHSGGPLKTERVRPENYRAALFSLYMAATLSTVAFVLSFQVVTFATSFGPSWLAMVVRMSGFLSLPVGVLSLVLLDRGERTNRHQLALAGGFLCLLPLNPFVVILLPVTLWALSVLRQPATRCAFATGTLPPLDAAETRRRKPLILAAVASIVIGLAVPLAVITIVTDSGTLEIKSVDDSVEVRISKVADDADDSKLRTKLTVVDTVTGSKVIRLPLGEYKVFLVDQENEFTLNRDGFTLSRGGEVVVEMTKKEQGPDTEEPTAPVASDATRKELLTLIKAARGTSSDDELKNVISSHSPVLTGFPLPISRQLVDVVTGLPESSLGALLDRGYLRWKFASLDAERKDAMRSLLRGLLSAAPQESITEDAIEITLKMLDKGDAGFAVLNFSEPSVQIIVWYAQLKNSPIPMMLPLSGVKSSGQTRLFSRSVYKQLAELEDKPYSDLPTTKNEVSIAKPTGKNEHSEQERAAHESALAWLKLVDDKKYAASRDEMSEIVRSSVTAEEWTKKVAPVRQQTGAIVHRKLKQARYTMAMPELPGIEGVILQFDSEFTVGKAASETIAVVLDKDDRWRVASYTVVPRAVDRTTTAETPHSKQEQAAHQAALTWLKLVDDKKYAASRDATSDYVRSSVTAEQWTEKVAPVRQKTGALVGRKLKQARYTTKIPGSPAGDRVIVQFDSEFTNLKAASETVTAVLDKDNRWRVAKYVVLPRGVSKTSHRSADEADKKVVRSFDAKDTPITQTGVTREDGGWKIVATEPGSVRLFEREIDLTDARLIYRAKIKTENLKGKAYLEMWVRAPGIGEAFSKGLNQTVSGTTGWATYEVPMFVKKGERVDLAKLNVAIEGQGTVWIKDIELLKTPLPNTQP